MQTSHLPELPSVQRPWAILIHPHACGLRHDSDTFPDRIAIEFRQRAEDVSMSIPPGVLASIASVVNRNCVPLPWNSLTRSTRFHSNPDSPLSVYSLYQLSYSISPGKTKASGIRLPDAQSWPRISCPRPARPRIRFTSFVLLSVITLRRMETTWAGR